MEQKILIVDDEPEFNDLRKQDGVDALVSPARHNLLGILPFYAMMMGNFRLTDLDLPGGKRVETYGSKKVGIWEPDTWKEKCKTQPKQGRNQPCNCGSGKKYKHCCALSANDLQLSCKPELKNEL